MPLPKMVKVRQHFPAPEIKDIPMAIHHTLKDKAVLSLINEGDNVAIAVGSRGVAAISIIVRELVQALKGVGANPFIVPAMGSHGGATAEGQRGVLEHLGVTEENVGAPIRATMDVEQLGQLENGLPVYMDKLAFQADKIVVVNRIKPHTAFRGKWESGLMKMITIGLGKQKGAEAAHQYGFKYMADHVPQMATIALSKAPIVFGLAILENAFDKTAFIEAIASDEIANRERDLLKLAKELMPQIKFNPLDVLVVDEIGKDISGDGMDPNISGRFPTPYADGGIDAKRVVVLDLTEKTNGNANGIGLADLITRKAFDKIDLSQGYANALTSTVVDTVKIPMILDSDKLAIQAAIKTCNAFDFNKIRLVRIKHTLDIGEIWISESLLEEARGRSDISLLSEVPVQLI